MAQWNENPSWTPFEQINGGNRFERRLSAEDLNTLAENIAYLKSIGVTGDATAKEFTVVEGLTYYANNQKHTGTMRHFRNIGYTNLSLKPNTIPNAPDGYFDIYARSGSYFYVPPTLSFENLEGEAIASIQEANLISANIKQGVNIFGIVGSYEGEKDVIKLQEKTVTPTKSIQNVLSDSAYEGLSKVIVNPIPEEYVIPNGRTYAYDEGIFNVSGFEEVEVSIPKTTKEVTFKENGTYEVESDYGLLQRAVVTVAVPQIDIALSDQAEPEDVAEGKSFVNNNGVQVGRMHSVANMLGITFEAEGSNSYGTLYLKGTSSSQAFFPSGVTVGGIGAITDNNFLAENIRKGVSIFGLEGSYVGGSPSGELKIKRNGRYDVVAYSTVNVDVPPSGNIPAEALKLSGNCSYRFAYDGWNWFIKNYGANITTENITHVTRMFSNSYDLENIPFELNITPSTLLDMTAVFSDCQRIETIPKINNCLANSRDEIFNGCYRLRSIPEDIFNNWDWTYMDTATSGYVASAKGMFRNCKSLRTLPMIMLQHNNPVAVPSYAIYNQAFNGCASLDEIVDLPVPYTNVVWTSNAFSYGFYYCNRLKNLTFATNNGTPYVVSWKAQTIDLTTSVGYSTSATDITNYNSGISQLKNVTGALMYGQLKDDPDWFTTNVNYSRYNHDSAVATINSLPDTSAYLATAGGTNTIKFKGDSGKNTDGGAINTLTEAEIAVATAKGWTVTFS